ncbi:MAG: hypothetical protein LQ340_005234 [Diploschistes diacapsis]|nr:MAG: hypothetical protein LQ340_005234 [Diploschistes diacapsis]
MHSSSFPSTQVRCLKHASRRFQVPRSFSTSASRRDEALQTVTPPEPPAAILDPNTVYGKQQELELSKQGLTPVGSRRRRAALLSSQNMPFEQLPYQCFQEARKILQADREDKISQINAERRRISIVSARDAATMGGENTKKGRIMAMERHLEQLKIQADINDPVIKKRFEDGQGDMNRPIYRHLAEKKWRSYKRKLLMQRLTQMHIVPDVLPHLDPVADISFTFGRRHIQPGEYVDSLISERVPKLTVQVYDKASRLVSIVVMDPDIPNLETDGFDFRCHYFAANIPLNAKDPHLYLSKLSTEDHVILPWMPPHAQKGSLYHRLAIFVCEQQDGKRIDVAASRGKEVAQGFNFRSFMDRYHAKPIAATIFRNEWDANTRGIMERAGLEGANVELKRKRGEKLPYRKKDGERYR